jgi:NAD(P)-dependent dehydrogenase (short-subunit alcohol dehydrogenase family)
VTSARNLFSLDGRVALVIGGSKGLGRAIAEGFAQAGAQAAIVARNKADLAATARDITAATKVRVLAIAGDIGRFAEAERIAAETLGVFRRIDILVNSAGVVVRGPLEQTTEADFDLGMKINAMGPWAMCRAVVPAMRRRGGGSIINVVSAMGVVGMRNRAIYGASKAALTQITRALAVELAPLKIRVNAISPGPFATEGTVESRQTDRWEKMIETRIPMQRTADPKEIRGPAIFLASEASSYITGALINVDGGWTAA